MRAWLVGIVTFLFSDLANSTMLLHLAGILGQSESVRDGP
jgi:hypothetical protein